MVEFQGSGELPRYEPPTVTRVRVEPLREILLVTACGFSDVAVPSCNPNAIPPGSQFNS
jgi:hypothetical protein